MAVHVYVNHKNLDRITDDYIEIQNDIYSLQAASDLMSAKSNVLMEKEIHAMALIASLDEKEEYFPDELKEKILTDEELKLSTTEKKDKAYSLVFGDGYSWRRRVCSYYD